MTPESLQEGQNKVGEAQTLQHSRDPQPGAGHYNTVNSTHYEHVNVLFKRLQIDD